MLVFNKIEDYEQLVFCNDAKSGLRGIICIHDTTLGPALGGCRLYNYDNEESAIEDVTRLAKGMTYKSAVTGFNWGGGKSIIWADPTKINREHIFRLFGKFVESLNGRYITAEDVNTTPLDMQYIHQSTRYVTGTIGKTGNPSWYTAKGTYMGMKACIEEKLKTKSFKGVRIAVQGIGSVAYQLIKMLHNDGAIIIATDINKNKCQELKAEFPEITIVSPDAIVTEDCDILAPCALGGVVNKENVDQIKAKIIAGCANNQLQFSELAKTLQQKGILYAPDYVINAGGLAHVSREFNLTEEEATSKIDNIYNVMIELFNSSKTRGISTLEAADYLAEKRIAMAKDLNSFYSKTGITL